MSHSGIPGSGAELTIISSRIFPGDADPFPGYIRVFGSKIVGVGRGSPPSRRGAIDVGDNAVIPGLIDLHIHGSGGFDAASGNVAGLEGMARFLASHGVTSFQPTVGAAPVANMERAISAVKEFTKSRSAGAFARSLGLHLEGPFLNPEMPGAIPAESLLRPDVSLAAKWLEMGEGTIRRVTVSPELRGAPDLVRRFASSGVKCSMGHTRASYEEAVSGFAAGITSVTHTFNAMKGFHHRDPGALGAALTAKGVYCELIADGIHVHPVAMKLLVAAQGRDAVCLVSDALPPAGLPPGRYEFLGRPVSLDEQGRVTLSDGTLAGSSASLRHCLENVVKLAGVPFADALRMATVNPAKSAGVFEAMGSLAAGKDADIVVLAPDYEVLWCLVEGKVAKSPER